jgi:hypothetical protein
MDKVRRQKRFEQKVRNKQKWRKRVEGEAKMLGEDPAMVQSREWVDHQVHLLTNHGKLCSCHMCGNPRRHFNERTIQEKRHEEMYGSRYQKD